MIIIGSTFMQLPGPQQTQSLDPVDTVNFPGPHLEHSVQEVLLQK